LLVFLILELESI